MTEALQVEGEKAASILSEEYKYVQKTENDMLQMLRRCEPLDTNQMDELLAYA